MVSSENPMDLTNPTELTNQTTAFREGQFNPKQDSYDAANKFKPDKEPEYMAYDEEMNEIAQPSMVSEKSKKKKKYKKRVRRKQQLIAMPTTETKMHYRSHT